MTKQIIAFNGKAGSGKGFSAERLVDEQNFTKFSFADSLREVVYNILGMHPMSEYEYSKYKYEKVFHDLTFRNILENTGEAIRAFQPNFWADACVSKFKNVKTNICIDDLRHANEYFAVKEYCAKNNIEFKLVFCDYRSDRYQEHNDHASAQMAKFLQEKGYKDQEIVDELDILIYKMSIEDKRK